MKLSKWGVEPWRNKQNDLNWQLQNKLINVSLILNLSGNKGEDEKIGRESSKLNTQLSSY